MERYLLHLKDRLRNLRPASRRDALIDARVPRALETHATLRNLYLSDDADQAVRSIELAYDGWLRQTPVRLGIMQMGLRTHERAWIDGVILASRTQEDIVPEAFVALLPNGELGSVYCPSLDDAITNFWMPSCAYHADLAAHPRGATDVRETLRRGLLPEELKTPSFVALEEMLLAMADAYRSCGVRPTLQ